MGKKRRIEIPTYSPEGGVHLPETREELVEFIVKAMVKAALPAVETYAEKALKNGRRASTKPIAEAVADVARLVKGKEPGDLVPLEIRPESKRLKLGSEDAIRALCRRRKAGASYKELQAEFGVSRAVVWRTLRANGLTGEE